jgi:hypothetical protein
MDAIHIPTAPGPWAPQALLIVQIPNAQEIIIVLQENYPTYGHFGFYFRHVRLRLRLHLHLRL